MGNEDFQITIDARSESPKPYLDAIKNKIILGANLKFDLTRLKYRYGFDPENVYDIMLAEMCIHLNSTAANQKGFYSLASIAERYGVYKYAPQNQLCLFPGAVLSKGIREGFNELKDEQLSTEQLEYTRFDIILPALIKKKQHHVIKKNKLEGVVELENRFLTVLKDIELNGIPLNIDMWLENERYWHTKLDYQEKLLYEWLAYYHPDLTDFNWNSPKQMVELCRREKISTKIIDKDESTLYDKVYKDTAAKTHLQKYARKH